MACFEGDKNDGIGSANTLESIYRTATPTLDPRSYQTEMFEASMKENIIVAMATGSGKTMVARLRIEAELQRTPTKRIWFTTPNVLLAEQQHRFFCSQLPSYSFRLITGADNVQFWSTQQVWDSALAGQQVVVSTPEVLRAALGHGFVSLSDISLLIFDEAHHCMKNHPTNLIMQQCPVGRNHIKSMNELEQNLSAVCRTPTLNLEDYQSFVHMPQLVPLNFHQSPTQESRLLPILGGLIREYSILTDPVYLRLKQNTSLSDKDQLEKIIRKNETPILGEVKRLFNQAAHLEKQIGAWAADNYITTCVTAFSTLRRHEPLSVVSNKENIHLYALLSPILVSIPHLTSPNPTTENISGKALALISYLAENCESEEACIVFVERRATAWALRELLASLKELAFWKPFALVGICNALSQGLADLVDQQMPHSALEYFRKGSLNLCIATSVLEEGIDVQACNLVICFDDSPNVRSFIQRRGRARRPGSKYAILQESTSPGQFSKYQVLEDQMKAAYAELDRQIDAFNELESTDEDFGRHYYVQSTGAYLTIDQARAHLAHFCNLLPHRDGRQNPAPIYIMEGIPGEEVSCRVILPASLPAHLQVTKSSAWRTGKMAKKDAAFRAYVELHKHGLLSDNLLPHVCETHDTKIEEMYSFYDAAPIVNPWYSFQCTINQFHQHRIRIQHSEMALPPLLLLLPVALCHQLIVNLFGNVVATATISISPWEEKLDYDQSFANEATKLLFSSVLQRRLGAVDLDELTMPYYVIPDILAGSMESWIESAKLSCPVPMFDFRAAGRSSYLIRKQDESSPYIYTILVPPGDEAMDPCLVNLELDLLRISKQMDFLSSSVKPLPQVRRVHNAADCSIIGLHPEYAVCMTYIPSIMHVVEIAIRTHLARIGPLHSIGLGASDEALLSSAFTAPGAGQTDYQRLEFIGDSLLKYWATVHVFCLNPHMPENLLTNACHRLINNARLRQTTCNLGLEAYFTSNPFSGRKWSLEQKPESQVPRVIASKTLADIIEALIGVAYADVEHAPMNANSQRIQRALCLFLPEIPWQIPSDLIGKLQTTNAVAELAGLSNLPASDHLNSVESLIGYSFANKSTLLTALTHSTLQIGRQTYERLEFLGDAIIDIIVKQKLWHSPLEMSEGQMTTRHASLVNKDIFAYVTTKLAVEKETKEVNVDPRTKQVRLTAKRQHVCLHDFMLRLADREFIDQRERFMKRFEAIKERLEQELATGQEFPWTDLYHLNAPKWCSDILESIVGAVYVDSSASLQACEAVLASTGLMELIARAVGERDIIYRQPLVRLRMLSSYLRVENNKRREAEGAPLIFDCRLSLDRKELGRYTGASCQAEAENKAADTVLRKIAMGEVNIKQKTGGVATEEYSQEEGELVPVCADQQESDRVQNDVS
ncbi:hypothetical protein DV736_g3349, partial [Chaetothyriales sp. CBS 134916]